MNNARLFVGACAPIPMRTPRAEKAMMKKVFTEKLAVKAGQTASQEALPITDVRATQDYRNNMVAVITKRALLLAHKRALIHRLNGLKPWNVDIIFLIKEATWINISVIGKDIPRVDGREKATGAAIYTDDIKLPGMLHGKLLRSPVPHARIRSIDVSKAKRLPGVKCVITGEDTPKIKYGNWRLFPATQDEYPLACGQGAFHRGRGCSSGSC